MIEAHARIQARNETGRTPASSLSWGTRPRADPDMADPTSKQRLTKAERKEEARRQRVELQRKMAKTRRNRRIAMGVVVALVVVARRNR